MRSHSLQRPLTHGRRPVAKVQRGEIRLVEHGGLPLDREALLDTARAAVASFSRNPGRRAGARSSRQGRSGFSGSTSTPLSRCSICSGSPPTRVAITGTPAAIASRLASGNASCREASTKSSQRSSPSRPAGGPACSRAQPRRPRAGPTALELDVFVQAGLADVLEAKLGATLWRASAAASRKTSVPFVRHTVPIVPTIGAASRRARLDVRRDAVVGDEDRRCPPAYGSDHAGNGLRDDDEHVGGLRPCAA